MHSGIRCFIRQRRGSLRKRGRLLLCSAFTADPRERRGDEDREIIGCRTPKHHSRTDDILGKEHLKHHDKAALRSAGPSRQRHERRSKIDDRLRGNHIKQRCLAEKKCPINAVGNGIKKRHLQKRE